MESLLCATYRVGHFIYSGKALCRVRCNTTQLGCQQGWEQPFVISVAQSVKCYNIAIHENKQTKSVVMALIGNVYFLQKAIGITCNLESQCAAPVPTPNGMHHLSHGLSQYAI